MLFLDKIEKGIIYVMGQKVHRNDEKYYLKLLEEGRRKEQIHGDNPEEWEEQKYLNKLEKQRLAVSKMQRLQRNRSSKKEQDLYN